MDPQEPEAGREVNAIDLDDFLRLIAGHAVRAPATNNQELVSRLRRGGMLER